MPPHDYDVAISFLAKDEPLALEIRARLAPLRVFVYSKAQGEVAGQEGVAAFREVFRHRSLVALVLFRPSWGQSPWTRVEETAIIDRCLEAGWGHLMFVKFDKADKSPPWVPDSHIYLDLQAFDLAELIGVLKARCASLGVEVHPPTAADHARLLAAAEKLQNETEQLLRTSAQPLYDAAAPLFAAVEHRLADIQESTGWTINRSSGQQHGRPDFVAFTDPVSIQLYAMWNQSNAEGILQFTLFRGHVPTPDERMRGMVIVMQEPKRLHDEPLTLARVAEHGWCWRYRGHIYSTEAAAELVVREFIDARERQRKKKDTMPWG
jgi:hypothetical protein